MSATTASDSHMISEARNRPRVSIVASVAGLLLLATAILQTVGPKVSVQEATLVLITENKRAGLDILAGVINLFGSAAIALTLVFLIDATRARNPATAPWFRWVAVVGAALSGVAGLVYSIEIAQKAHQFVSSGTQTYEEAHHLTSSGLIVALPALALLGALLVAVAFVLISLQAMRVGLLTRFMGYVGMFVGALVLFPILPLPVVEIYWFFALAVLLAGRWPGGEPAAWRSGRAERWPTAQELREQRIRAAGGKVGGRQAARPAGKAGAKAAGAGKAAAPSGTNGDTAAATTTATTSARTGAKRKRKRKR
jgi:hypothetical protein